MTVRRGSTVLESQPKYIFMKILATNPQGGNLSNDVPEVVEKFTASGSEVSAVQESDSKYSYLPSSFVPIAIYT